MTDDQNSGGGRPVCSGAKAQRLADAALVQIGKAPRIKEPPPAEASRRDFLSMMGFSLGAAGLQACRAPVQHAIPLPTATPEMVPGVSLTFATTCGGCPSSCALLVKQRDGRPIKIDGNPASPLFGGGTCATGQATVLSLYDRERLRGPIWRGQATSWPQIDAHVAAGLPARDSSIVLLSGSITSPSTRALIGRWARRFPGFRHVVYDAISASGLRDATGRIFGRAVVPHYRFDQARVVVALEADFLGTWLSPVEFARGYASTRRAHPRSSWHVQFESGYSVTGSNADLRVPVAPSELGAVAAALFQRLVLRAGAKAPVAAAGLLAVAVTEDTLDAVVHRLWQARGESLVVSGSNDRDVQLLVAAMNVLLGNAPRTVGVNPSSLQRQGDDRALAGLLPEMKGGRVATLIVHGVNPGHDHPQAHDFLQALKTVPLSIALSPYRDETSALCHAICPDHHFLESWGDAEPVEGHFSLAQPLIAPLGATRAATESLMRWLGEPTSHYDHIRDHWRKTLFPRQVAEPDFDRFWDGALQRGVLRLPHASTTSQPRSASPPPSLSPANWSDAAAAVERVTGRLSARPASGCELHAFESVPLRDGQHANNPWLQELPDPITRTTWGNVASVSPELAKQLSLVTGDVVSLTMAGRTLELPAFVQSGQARRAVSVALGHGRVAAGPAGNQVGANAFALGAFIDGARRYDGSGLAVARTGRRVRIPSAQTHLSMEGRPIALTMTVAELGEAPAEKAHGLPTLWKAPPAGARAWGMAIDLDACTGCSACVVACQAENNVPVVGKDQVQRERIMHWLRIDRYFEGADDAVTSLHQPMMCQHCANAPCETVCPVLATTTSSEGLNQQTYNRCIGTRYCANNCPYKVRRFNWLEYTRAGPHASHMEDPLGRLVLNPDVTVRTRGVMEKCSLCVQRIQLGKNQALQQRRALGDGDVVTACQQSCPTDAITFGDLMDPQSRVARLLKGPRAYHLLDDLGTRPAVSYLKRLTRPPGNTGDGT